MYSLCTFFFFYDTATTEIYTLSLHDALPIFAGDLGPVGELAGRLLPGVLLERAAGERDALGLLLVLALLDLDEDRKSTRLNSSHSQISYAVFCLKKKNITNHLPHYHITRRHT